MTAPELIEKLKEMPQDVEIIFWNEWPESWYSTKVCDISVNPHTGYIDFEI